MSTVTNTQNASGQPTLPRNKKREAIPALTGYDYQVWVAMSQWFDLSDNAVLFMEGAEDLDNVEEHSAETVQIRHTQAKISLNTSYAREAIVNFWNLLQREQHGRDIKYLYLTTSEVTLENNANFGGISGINFWDTAKHNQEHALHLAKYLAMGISAPQSLLEFLKSEDPQQLQSKLFLRFTWLTSQPGIDIVSEIVLDKIQIALKKIYEHDYPKASLEQIRAQLHGYCWEQLRKNDLSERILTKKSLLTELQKAATITVTLPLHASASILGMATHLNLHGSALTIAMLVESVPILPAPTLLRKSLTASVKSKLDAYIPVLLTGTVHQGKTTIASIVANALDRNAFWVDLADRPAGQIREIFNFFSLFIEKPDFPNLIVFDDINTNPSQQAIYSRALQKLIFKANNLGKSLLLTARGSSEAVDAQFNALNAETVEVKSMSLKDIEVEAIELGCDASRATQWGAIVEMQTSGHAKLVQVRLNELCVKGWLQPTADDFLGTSQALQNERYIARALLSESLNANGDEVEFVYTAAELNFSPSRTILLNLGDLFPGISSAGDLVSRLEGKWLEAATGGRLRVTPLIKAEAGVNWSEGKFRLAHKRLFDAISQQNSITPIEGSGLIFHGYICKDGERLTQAVVNTLAIKDSSLKVLVFRNLTWLSSIGHEIGKSIFPEQKLAALFLRNLQFQMAAHEENENIEKILSLWWYELESSIEELQVRMSQILHVTVLTAQIHVPMKLVAKSAKLFENGDSPISLDIKSNLLSDKNFGEIPNDSTPFQIFLALKQNISTSIETFVDLVSWLEVEEDTLVLQFDEIIGWPISQHCGAFVHSAWVNYSKKNVTWVDLLDVFYSAWQLSKNRGMRNFGIEIAKAISLIESEYKNEQFIALQILDAATKDFGASVILEEQRANCYFHSKQYDNVVIVWRNIDILFQKKVIDPFAYRRAGIAAAEIKNWEQAAAYFEAGARCLPVGTPLPTRSSLYAEAALAHSKAGLLDKAVELMRQCEEELPQAASLDGDARWEATLRVLAAAAIQIRGDAPSTPTGESFTLKSGFSSNPELNMQKTDKLQKFRLAIFKLEVHTSYLYVHTENKNSLYQIKTLSLINPQITFLATNNMLVLQLRQGIKASYFEYLAKFVDASEAMRSQSPYSTLSYSEESLVIGHLILPLLLKKIEIQDFIKLCNSKENLIDTKASSVALTEVMKQFKKTPKMAGETLVDENAALATRAGAAMVILKSGGSRADALTAAQALLALVSMRAIIAMKSSDIEFQLAAEFIEFWRPVVLAPAQLKNPDWTVPALNEVFRDVRRKKAGLKQLLKCASAASGVNIDGIISSIPERN
ncbi:Uncharacterised protein [Janthinobacterium lividum]|nr:hypothetical protein JANLI_10150 [Janthinobacterium lividum]STS86119.1 Uncharacterised protein [Janthinobacterium lividum]